MEHVHRFSASVQYCNQNNIDPVRQRYEIMVNSTTPKVLSIPLDDFMAGKIKPEEHTYLSKDDLAQLKKRLEQFNWRADDCDLLRACANDPIVLGAKSREVGSLQPYDLRKQEAKECLDQAKEFVQEGQKLHQKQSQETEQLRQALLIAEKKV